MSTGQQQRHSMLVQERERLILAKRSLIQQLPELWQHTYAGMPLLPFMPLSPTTAVPLASPGPSSFALREAASKKKRRPSPPARSPGGTSFGPPVSAAAARAKRLEDIWRACSTILVKKLWQSKHAIPFLQPVDPIKLGIPDYLNHVRHPMDLRTIRERMAANRYSSPLEFRDDVRLVWNNCAIYNHPGNPVRTMGDILSDIWERAWLDSNVEACWNDLLRRYPVDGHEQLAVNGGWTHLPMVEPVVGWMDETMAALVEKRRLAHRLSELGGEHIQSILDIVHAHEPGLGVDPDNPETEFTLDLDLLSPVALNAVTAHVDALTGYVRPPLTKALAPSKGTPTQAQFRNQQSGQGSGQGQYWAGQGTGQGQGHPWMAQPLPQHQWMGGQQQVGYQHLPLGGFGPPADASFRAGATGGGGGMGSDLDLVPGAAAIGDRRVSGAGGLSYSGGPALQGLKRTSSNARGAAAAAGYGYGAGLHSVSTLVGAGVTMVGPGAPHITPAAVGHPYPPPGQGYVSVGMPYIGPAAAMATAVPGMHPHMGSYPAVAGQLSGPSPQPTPSFHTPVATPQPSPSPQVIHESAGMLQPTAGVHAVSAAPVQGLEAPSTLPSTLQQADSTLPPSQPATAADPGLGVSLCTASMPQPHAPASIPANGLDTALLTEAGPSSSAQALALPSQPARQPTTNANGLAPELVSQLAAAAGLDDAAPGPGVDAGADGGVAGGGGGGGSGGGDGGPPDASPSMQLDATPQPQPDSTTPQLGSAATMSQVPTVLIPAQVPGSAEPEAGSTADLPQTSCGGVPPAVLPANAVQLSTLPQHPVAGSRVAQSTGAEPGPGPASVAPDADGAPPGGQGASGQQGTVPCTPAVSSHAGSQQQQQDAADGSVATLEQPLDVQAVHSPSQGGTSVAAQPPTATEPSPHSDFAPAGVPDAAAGAAESMPADARAPRADGMPPGSTAGHADAEASGTPAQGGHSVPAAGADADQASAALSALVAKAAVENGSAGAGAAGDDGQPADSNYHAMPLQDAAVNGHSAGTAVSDSAAGKPAPAGTANDAKAEGRAPDPPAAAAASEAGLNCGASAGAEAQHQHQHQQPVDPGHNLSHADGHQSLSCSKPQPALDPSPEQAPLLPGMDAYS